MADRFLYLNVEGKYSGLSDSYLTRWEAFGKAPNDRNELEKFLDVAIADGEKAAAPQVMITPGTIIQPVVARETMESSSASSTSKPNPNEAKSRSATENKKKDAEKSEDSNTVERKTTVDSMLAQSPYTETSTENQSTFTECRTELVKGETFVSCASKASSRIVIGSRVKSAEDSAALLDSICSEAGISRSTITEEDESSAEESSDDDATPVGGKDQKNKGEEKHSHDPRRKKGKKSSHALMEHLDEIEEEEDDEELNHNWRRIFIHQIPYWVRKGTPLGAVGVCTSWFSNPKRLTDLEIDAEFKQLLHSTTSTNFAIMVLRSGRFSGAIFNSKDGKTIVHRNFSRYTTRAKQGGSQSAKDNTGKSIKSAGSQLRRYGEQQLENDMKNLFIQWRKELEKCGAHVFLSAGHAQLTSMKKQFPEGLPVKQYRKVPFPFQKPTLVEIEALAVQLRTLHVFTNADMEVMEGSAAKNNDGKQQSGAMQELTPRTKRSDSPNKKQPAYKEADDELFTPLHWAAKEGNLVEIEQILVAACEAEVEDDEKNTGDKSKEEKIAIIDPVIAKDGKGRVPYFMCANQKARDLFRMLRGRLGEEAFKWDEGKIPPALNDEIEEAKKQKEKEKRKRQREKQKANKGAKKAEEEERKKKEEEEARREEELLKGPKCQQCQKGCGPNANKWFRRLEYIYCSTECVKAHQRVLAADAAAKRFG